MGDRSKVGGGRDQKSGGVFKKIYRITYTYLYTYYEHILMGFNHLVISALSQHHITT